MTSKTDWWQFFLMLYPLDHVSAEASISVRDGGNTQATNRSVSRNLEAIFALQMFYFKWVDVFIWGTCGQEQLKRIMYLGSNYKPSWSTHPIYFLCFLFLKYSCFIATPLKFAHAGFSWLNQTPSNKINVNK